ncbi:hypothetical protein O7598_18110 [Micromonospora sp. WMMC241]|uniref:hypothetical protein n=1 Tax=Micromonospora sp. WMMC241 TaxID=3015159 RepID=UPI0022B73A02|nr:hypothetical protein [Micromonospora sp. WMMC241]MCZ7438327.1 hypothetical protein [Micromonospora sp. WMMC241]
MNARPASLVAAEELASPSAYRQLGRQRTDRRFRREVAAMVADVCRSEPDGRLLFDTFLSLTEALEAEGALSFAGLLPEQRFTGARQAYDAAVHARGSRGSLHNYLNVVDTEDLLAHPDFRETFAHPLLVVLVAYALGGPVRIIDLRAKDTHPVDVVARDNTLHVDNSPFMDEFKVVVTWRTGTGQGPSGQGLTYLPRTNRLLRQCVVDDDGSVRSDEDSCIFASRDRVDEALAAQARFFADRQPRVVHLRDLSAPCHTIFAASRLVHHRYRTSAGGPRSAVMASFHRTDEGTGVLGVTDVAGSGLDRFLLGGEDAAPFLDLVRAESPRIVAALGRARHRSGFVVDPERHLLRGDDLDAWYARQSAGISLNRLRAAGLADSRDQGISEMRRLVLRMQYDLQGALNMPLYADLREEVRKRARIVIREMAPEHIHDILARPRYAPVLGDPPAPDRRPVGELTEELSEALGTLARLMSGGPARASAGPVWGATGARAAVSALRRFVVDLRVAGEAVTDQESVVTAFVFGALGAALATDLLGLGEPGDHVAAGLLGTYLGLVGPSLDERGPPPHPERHRLDTYRESVNETMQTTKLASEVWFHSAPAETIARNDRFVRSLVGRVLPVVTGRPDADEVVPFRAESADLPANYWRRVAPVKPIAVRFGAADLDGVYDYLAVDADRGVEAVMGRLRGDVAPLSPAGLLLSGIERVAATRGGPPAEACRYLMSRLAADWGPLVRQSRTASVAGVPTAHQVFALLHDVIGRDRPASRAPGRPGRADAADEVLLSRTDARALARAYMPARLCFTDVEIRMAQRLARDPRVRHALLATHLHLVDESSGRAGELFAEWGDARVLLPFTEAFVWHGPTGAGLAPNPKLLTVMCNNLLPAVAAELSDRGGRGADDLDADMLRAGVDTAVRRGVFSVTVGLFRRTAHPDVVSLAGFNRRTCPAAGSFSAFCRRWLPRFFADWALAGELPRDAAAAA